jgi:hypothetical protein
MGNKDLAKAKKYGKNTFWGKWYAKSAKVGHERDNKRGGGR